jgi:hypothetical protein
MKDGDFNFLEINNFKGFYCRPVYNYIFNDFQQKLKDNIDGWKENMKQKNIENLIAIFGPFDGTETIPGDKKIFVWKKSVQAYYINITTSNRSSSYLTNNITSNISSNNSLFYGGMSPFFIYGNSYRNSDISSKENSINTTLSLTNESGKIISKDEGFIFSIIQDINNRTVEIYQENIFSEPQYGSPFKFISF